MCLQVVQFLFALAHQSSNSMSANPSPPTSPAAEILEHNSGNHSGIPATEKSSQGGWANLLDGERPPEPKGSLQLELL